MTERDVGCRERFGTDVLENAMPDQQFIDEAIHLAEQAGYYPAQGQRNVDWDEVAWWAGEVQKPGFQWHPRNTSSPIIVAADGAIADGQHRILGGLMGNNPVPDVSIDFWPRSLGTQSWK